MCNFHVSTTNHTIKLTNPNYDQKHKYHRLDTKDFLLVLRQVAGSSELGETHWKQAFSQTSLFERQRLGLSFEY